MSWPLQLFSFSFLFFIHSSTGLWENLCSEEIPKGKGDMLDCKTEASSLSPVLSSLPSKLHTNMSSQSCICTGCKSRHVLFCYVRKPSNATQTHTLFSKPLMFMQDMKNCYGSNGRLISRTGAVFLICHTGVVFAGTSALRPELISQAMKRCLRWHLTSSCPRCPLQCFEILLQLVRTSYNSLFGTEGDTHTHITAYALVPFAFSEAAR